MNSKIYFMFHGLPGSGKSTMAEQLMTLLSAMGVENIRLNRDDLRTVVAGVQYHSGEPQQAVEARVTKDMNDLLYHATSNGIIIIDDNTNMRERYINQTRTELAKRGYKIIHIMADVPVEVAKERNKSRGESGGRLVPDSAIDNFAKTGYSKGRIDAKRLAGGDPFLTEIKIAGLLGAIEEL